MARQLRDAAARRALAASPSRAAVHGGGRCLAMESTMSSPASVADFDTHHQQALRHLLQ
jgi:hypothetical protein